MTYILGLSKHNTPSLLPTDVQRIFNEYRSLLLLSAKPREYCFQPGTKHCPNKFQLHAYAAKGGAKTLKGYDFMQHIHWVCLFSDLWCLL